MTRNPRPEEQLRGGSAEEAHVGAAAQRAGAKKGAEARDAREREEAEARAECERVWWAVGRGGDGVEVLAE